MKGRSFAMVFLLSLCWLLLACPGDLRLKVLYDRVDGLRSGDRVVHQGQTVGDVQSVALGPQGRVAVDLQISRSFREKVTDQSRFLITEDPKRPEDRFVEVIQLAEGCSPLADGAEVEGSTALSLEFERTRRAGTSGMVRTASKGIGALGKGTTRTAREGMVQGARASD